MTVRIKCRGMVTGRVSTSVKTPPFAILTGWETGSRTPWLICVSGSEDPLSQAVSARGQRKRPQPPGVLSLSPGSAGSVSAEQGLGPLSLLSCSGSAGQGSGGGGGALEIPESRRHRAPFSGPGRVSDSLRTYSRG